MRDGQLNVQRLKSQLVGGDDLFIEDTLFVGFMKATCHLTIATSKTKVFIQVLT